MPQEILYQASKRYVMDHESKAKLKTNGYMYFIVDEDDEFIGAKSTDPARAWISAANFIEAREPKNIR